MSGRGSSEENRTKIDGYLLSIPAGIFEGKSVSFCAEDGKLEQVRVYQGELPPEEPKQEAVSAGAEQVKTETESPWRVSSGQVADRLWGAANANTPQTEKSRRTEQAEPQKSEKEEQAEPQKSVEGEQGAPQRTEEKAHEEKEGEEPAGKKKSGKWPLFILITLLLTYAQFVVTVGDFDISEKYRGLYKISLMPLWIFGTGANSAGQVIANVIRMFGSVPVLYGIVPLVGLVLVGKRKRWGIPFWLGTAFAETSMLWNILLIKLPVASGILRIIILCFAFWWVFYTAWAFRLCGRPKKTKKKKD